jgi:hypothetical protein
MVSLSRHVAALRSLCETVDRDLDPLRARLQKLVQLRI